MEKLLKRLKAYIDTVTDYYHNHPSKYVTEMADKGMINRTEQINLINYLELRQPDENYMPHISHADGWRGEVFWFHTNPTGRDLLIVYLTEVFYDENNQKRKRKR